MRFILVTAMGLALMGRALASPGGDDATNGQEPAGGADRFALLVERNIFLRDRRPRPRKGDQTADVSSASAGAPSFEPESDGKQYLL